MPAYSGYKSPADYILRRLSDKQLRQVDIVRALKFRASYVSGLCRDEYNPSRPRCKAIAKFFGDDPNILLIVAGHTSLPVDLSERTLREIYDTALTLTPKQRQETVRFMRFLKADD